MQIVHTVLFLIDTHPYVTEAKPCTAKLQYRFWNAKVMLMWHDDCLLSIIQTINTVLVWCNANTTRRTASHLKSQGPVMSVFCWSSATHFCRFCVYCVVYLRCDCMSCVCNLFYGPPLTMYATSDVWEINRRPHKPCTRTLQVYLE